MYAIKSPKPNFLLYLLQYIKTSGKKLISGEIIFVAESPSL